MEQTPSPSWYQGRGGGQKNMFAHASDGKSSIIFNLDKLEHHFSFSGSSDIPSSYIQEKKI